MEECISNKILKEKMQESNNENYEMVESLNKNSVINENTKLLIIGSITPFNAIDNYYYCSKRNHIYGYIDEALGTNFKELKNNLNDNIDSNTRKTIINKIKLKLKDNNIAFIDIIDSAIRIKNDSRDSSIKFYTIDNMLNKIIDKYKNNNLTIICNSRFVETLFKEKTGIDCIYLSQRSGLKKDWIDAIQKALNK